MTKNGKPVRRMLGLAMGGLLAASTLAPATASAALAGQDAGRQDGGRQDRGGGDDRGRPDGQPGRPAGQQGGPAPQVQGQVQVQGGSRPDGRGPGSYQRGNRGPGYAGQHYGDQRGGQGGWNRGWRQDRRFDWSGYRQQNRGLFGLPRYAAPYGWHYGYRRFDVGISLNAALFGRSYWIANPWAYRLPPAYGDLRWVRYYNDALLVDLDTGRVVDSVYGIFY